MDKAGTAPRRFPGAILRDLRTLLAPEGETKLDALGGKVDALCVQLEQAHTKLVSVGGTLSRVEARQAQAPTPVEIAKAVALTLPRPPTPEANARAVVRAAAPWFVACGGLTVLAVAAVLLAYRPAPACQAEKKQVEALSSINLNLSRAVADLAQCHTATGLVEQLTRSGEVPDSAAPNTPGSTLGEKARRACRSRRAPTPGRSHHPAMRPQERRPSMARATTRERSVPRVLPPAWSTTASATAL